MDSAATHQADKELSADRAGFSQKDGAAEEVFRTERYSYELPRHLIAQSPLEERDQSRLMVLRRRGGESLHARFDQIRQHLREGDLLVVNNSRVFPARILGRKLSGGRVEALLIRPASVSPRSSDQAEPAGRDAGEWLCLIRCSGRLQPGQVLDFPDGVRGEAIGPHEEGLWRLRFDRSGPEFYAWLDKAGQVPLPVYIKRDTQWPADSSTDRVRYQTVFAKTAGSVAAPTAGFHFTDRLLDELRGSGIRICEITLHVGHSTFLPIRAADVRQHRLWPERFSISGESAEAIRDARQGGSRVVAVGTTVARCLESLAAEGDAYEAQEGWATAFILPGHRFRWVDALLTNFHLPRSTLLVLVAAFAGWERIRAAYREAVLKEYRFYSYGDCMLIEADSCTR
ncbi:MAG: tRNA preQ1(34) S-adenosylmethionine ribosyltransferase-isomerase QueA [bacterium]